MYFKSSIVYVIIITSFGLISCSDANIVYDEMQEIESQVWHAKDTVHFDFEIDDTLQKYDFFFNLRTTTSYEYSNLYLFTVLTSKNLVAFDTIDVNLADITGEWHGKVSGSMVENNVFFMHKVRFKEKGSHRISFIQAMREDDLPEIVDVGLTIKKVTQ